MVRGFCGRYVVNGLKASCEHCCASQQGIQSSQSQPSSQSIIQQSSTTQQSTTGSSTISK